MNRAFAPLQRFCAGLLKAVMENLQHTFKLKLPTIERSEERRAQSARSARSNASRSSTRARRYNSARSRRSDDDDESLLTSDSEEDDDDDEEEWIDVIDQATVLSVAMQKLYETDKLVFYKHGANIMKMIEYRLQHKDEFCES